MPPVLAATEWPDGYDWLITSCFLMLIIVVPLLGYVFMALDFHRYLRSLRRALAIVANRIVATTPAWAQSERHACLTALNLKMPCTEEDVLAAYRELAKTLHPDRGGDLQKFLRLQRQFEDALNLVRS